MMLRASVAHSGESVDLGGVVDTSIETGVEHGALLRDFAEALVRRSPALPDLREQIVEQIGPGALIDAAGTAANFQRMVRIADGIGIPLDDMMAANSGEIRAQLELNRYGSAANSAGLTGS